MPYRGAIDCVRQMISTEGAASFFAGIRPRVAYIAPLWATQFMLNEFIVSTFAEMNAKKKQQLQQ